LKKVLIFPSGIYLKNGDKLRAYGLGHVTRCLTLARYIKKREPAAEIFFASSGVEYSLCQKSEFRVFRLPVVGMNSSIWDGVQLTKFEVNLMRFLKPDIVISDTHNEAILAARYVGIPCVAICDLPPIMLFSIFAILADLIVIPHISQVLVMPDFLAQVMEKVQVVGPILSEECLEMQDKIAVRKELGVENEAEFIVAYASRISHDRMPYIGILLDAFKMLKKERAGVKLVLIGPGLSEETKIEDVKACEYVSSLIKHIKACDVFITRPPVSAMESVALGAPTIMIPIKGDVHQETIARRLNDLGVLCHLRLQELTPQLLKDKIHFLLTNDEVRIKTAIMGKKLIDGLGGKRAAELIVNMIKQSPRSPEVGLE